jgi:hypothetical protein
MRNKPSQSLQFAVSTYMMASNTIYIADFTVCRNLNISEIYKTIFNSIRQFFCVKIEIVFMIYIVTGGGEDSIAVRGTPHES